MQDKLRIQIDSLRIRDIPEVQRIEKLCFDDQWPSDSFENEITKNEVSCYIVACLDGKVIGYIGAWFLIDEAHIATIGVDPEYRNLGIGKLLVWKMLKIALENGCLWATLEVSEHNDAARHLYEKFGFKSVSQRKDYYKKGDNAIIMWSGNMKTSDYSELLNKIQREWEEKICLSSE